LKKIKKKFDLFEIQTHIISFNPHGLRANRTSPKVDPFPAIMEVERDGRNKVILPLSGVI
jgi:hypothetical protein